ncbi:endonuclease [Texas Phoenix palm phytoplasma]|uniref:Endonuclease n=1 Tax=Texas Phoenix palm phytoplasma TaxID=176709 RepID=A0ABS5BI73_9MOLU|nr:YqaJ viral recombinase family protein [Texas Phoenix palm phytoplasma]MBP3059282.1 endonuclease [Texas Phoenix palm phytoplasma]
MQGKKINLKQNSYEWFEHRKNFVNASEVGTIMGLNPYETQENLIKKKIFGSKFVTNEAMEHGKKTEPKANLFFSIKKKTNYEPSVFIRNFFSASLDGYDEKTKTILEIKCPLNKASVSWKEFFSKGEIPKYYWAQIQCGLYCSESEKAYFLVYTNDEDYVIKKVFLDEEFIQKMILQCGNYKKLLENYRNLMKTKKK